MRLAVISALVSMMLVSISSVVLAGDLKIQGFLSVGMSQMDDDDFSISGYNDELDFKNRNILGIQLSKQLNDNVSVTGQLVGRGEDDYAVDATWAYVTFAPSEYDSIRMGRLRVPFFYYSDFLEVGYAYNWITPPSDVYRMGFDSIDAIDYTRAFDMGDVTGSVQIYYGRWAGDLDLGLGAGPQEFDLTAFTGIVGNLGWENIALRLSYHQADITAQIPVELANPLVFADKRTSSFADAAVVYDDGANFAIIEYTVLKHDMEAVVDNVAYLVSYARRIGAFTIHGTYSYVENDFETDMQKVALGEFDDRVGMTLGLRWDFAESIAFKFEVQNREDTSPELPVAFGGGGGESEDGTLVSIGMDLIF